MNELLKEFGEINLKMMKFMRLCMNPPEIDVGTTSSEIVFEHEKMKLLRYKPITEKIYSPPLLIVYANINKPYILDLQPDKSVVRRFLEGGIEVYMIDWGETTDADMYLTIDDYINRFMKYAVEHIKKKRKVDKISIMGYCIGGFFTTIYASLYPENVKNLIIMAAPINFDTDKGPLHVWTKYFDPKKVTKAFTNCPADFLNGGFLLLNPIENLHLKYLNLFNNINNEKFVKNFLRMEKWIFDGVDVPGKFYEEYIRDGYQRNLLIKNELEVAGKKVDLGRIDMPLLVLVGLRDNLTPPDATTPLLEKVSSKDKKIFENVSGHIGISVGSRAHRNLWPRVVEWLVERSEISGD